MEDRGECRTTSRDRTRTNPPENPSQQASSQSKIHVQQLQSEATVRNLPRWYTTTKTPENANTSCAGCQGNHNNFHSRSQTVCSKVSQKQAEKRPHLKTIPVMGGHPVQSGQGLSNSLLSCPALNLSD
ncbi:low-density lipoprotein receptor-related protein 11 [Lates japonicus]|uniref:Low-density lipoprotein receptor-related protein 11 n=1 Tax=Lates japonicus TaxID=270547 RepID=A0AAD3NHP5_LATJO|nr:low-density lipoprotein receptor-related protein 11 [Lates japonicus]